MLFGRQNYGMCRNDGFDQKSLQAAWEWSESVWSFLDWSKDLGRQVQILLKVRFCRVWHSEIRTFLCHPLAFPLLHSLSYVKLQQTLLISYAVLLEIWDSRFTHGHFWWKISYFSPSTEKQKVLRYNLLLQREARLWLLGLEWKPARDGFLSGKYAISALRKPLEQDCKHLPLPSASARTTVLTSSTWLSSDVAVVNVRHFINFIKFLIVFINCPLPPSTANFHSTGQGYEGKEWFSRDALDQRLALAAIETF